MESPLSRDACCLVNPNKMCSSHDAVDMDDPFKRCPILIDFRLHNPHSCLLARFVTDTGVPVHQCTWICGTMIGKLQEQPNTTNVEAVHPFLQLISYCNYTVV